MELDRTQNVAKANSNTSSSTSASTSASTKGSSGTTSEASRNMVLSDAQFRTLISGLSVRQEVKSTFSNCTARFHGNRNSTNVEDFLATILVYKEAENISDFLALTSLPLLLEGYASSWWQGVKDEAKTFNDAVDLLRGAFAPPKPDWRIFSEIAQEKQKLFETTDSFICRKRRLFAQLSEKLSENTMLNMIFSQLSLKIRERIQRESVTSFHDLLCKAREIEMLVAENRQDKVEEKSKPAENQGKSVLRCTFCRKRNHLAENCFKKIEAEKHKNAKERPETNLNCYGCGAAGYYRSNCPFCNKTNSNTDPRDGHLDFNSMHSTVVGRNVPVVDINVNGLQGEAYFDTAARTSVAGYHLYQKLIQKEVPFQKVCAEIILADGIARNETVYSTVVDIIIGKRFKKIRFICLPKAIGNRTLLGIDFLEENNIVLDLAQRIWHFKDDPSTNFSFKLHQPGILNSISSIKKVNETPDDVKDFLSWFENGNNDYSPKSINKIFKDSVSENTEIQSVSSLFPPPKKVKYDEYCDEIFTPIELNSIDIKLRRSEGPHLTEKERKSLEELLVAEKEIFEDIDIPAPHVEHYIKTGSHEPIANAPYRISPKMKTVLKAELDKMLEKGIIQEEESPWAFPVVLIPKKDGSIRLCVDYRRLNAITTADTYPLPRIDDLLHSAKTTPFMSTLDLRSGYWQIKVAEKDRKKTAFTTPFGIYVFNRMPFGLKNAPATFQRLIDKFRNGLPNILILAYLDDIIICSKDLGSHISDLKQIFERLKMFGFHLNREKCFFCKPVIKYLGHILTTKGLKPDPEKTKAIMERPKPRNPKEVLSFLQTCSWYRRFIPSFANVSKPLSDLIKKNAIWRWSEREQSAFDTMKNLLSSPPILKQVDENLPFILKTDASNYALGAVLVQGEKEEEHIIEYASRLLLVAEKNYSTTEREALAVVWAVQKFRGYIEGSEVLVLTDHQPLKWLFSLKSPTGRLARWALQLQTFNIRFEYTPGRQNIVADTLSRPPCLLESHNELKCECMAIEIDFPHKGAEDFREAQIKDPALKAIIDSFENDDENVSKYTGRGYIMLDGVLYRFCSEEESENGQLVVPESMRSMILYNFHDVSTAGHYGIDRTISRISPHYYWPGMRKQITNYVRCCIECQRYKPSNLKPAGLLKTVSSNQRFEIIAIDLFGPLPRTPQGHQWILIVEDLCSRWTELFPLKTASAENCALILLNEVFLRYGIPRRVHSDNGTQFISSVMQKLTYCLGIVQSFTPVYHPEANPVERKNRDLKVQLSIYVGQDHTTWDVNLPSIRFAMNTAKCASTGYTAAYLTFGRELRTPMQVQTDLKAIVKAENFVPQITPHLLRLADSLSLAMECQEKMQDRNKLYADLKRRPQQNFEIGDRVLISTHILSKKDNNLTSKLVPRRDGPYIILNKKGTSCYTVASMDQPSVPIATYHSSDLTLYEGNTDKPLYKLKRRGRPRKASSTDNTEQFENAIATNKNATTTKPILKPKNVTPNDTTHIMQQPIENIPPSTNATEGNTTMNRRSYRNRRQPHRYGNVLPHHRDDF